MQNMETMEPKENTLSKGRFTLRTMLIWLLFLLFAIPQWMVMCLYAKNPLIYTLSLLVLGFILLSCIILIEKMKYKRPWNILCVLICYECLTVGIALFLTKWNLIYTLVLISVGVILTVITMFACFLMVLNDAYPNPSKIAIVGCMGFILVYTIRSIDLFTTWFFLRDIEVTIFLASVIIVMVCHVLMTNESFEVLRQDDSMHVAFILYICYMLLLVGCRVAAHCIQVNVNHFGSKKSSTAAPLKYIFF